MSGPVFRELWTKRHLERDRVVARWALTSRGTRRNREQLSPAALALLFACDRQITGMVHGAADYFFADAMSEAIEAAEALGL